LPVIFFSLWLQFSEPNVTLVYVKPTSEIKLLIDWNDSCILLGTYSTDDIAASLALSFCMTATKSVAMHARQQNIKSVVFFGSFLSQPPIREMLEACMAAESLMIPFIGVCVIEFFPSHFKKEFKK